MSLGPQGPIFLFLFLGGHKEYFGSTDTPTSDFLWGLFQV